MRGYLERSQLRAIDLRDQPQNTEFIVVAVGNGTPMIGLAADHVVRDEYGTKVYRGGRLLASFTSHVEVTAIRRDLCELPTSEEAIRQEHADRDARLALERELDPEAAEQYEGARELQRHQLSDMLNRFRAPGPPGAYL